jgi:nucleotide-binding universal stress UspA family protein
MTTNHLQSRDREMLLVGVDTNASSAAAVRWAAEEAQLRGARLHAVHVVDHSRRHDAPLEVDPGLELGLARETVPSRVAGWVFDAAIDIDLSVTVVCGELARELARESACASLLVIGAPDSTQQDALPGSLSSLCVCPVAVVGLDGDATFLPFATHHPEGAGHAGP